MAEFLVELYVPRTHGAAVKRGARDAERAAAELRGEGIAIRYVRTIFLPDDEICFYLYEADTVDSVREAARRAELRFERVAAAFGETG